MENNNNIAKTSTHTEHVDYPSMIIDKSGYIIALNPNIRKIIPNAAPKLNFFELFDTAELNLLQKIFLESKKKLSIVKDIIELNVEGISNKYEFHFSPLKSDNNIYFIIGVNEYHEPTLSTKSQKFIVAISDLEKITDNKHLLSVINKIKLTFPFTFIEKAKVQKEINELDEFFWVKDPEGKIILINDVYAASLGFTSSQLENKPEQDYLPKYLLNLYKTVDQYISATSNTVILDSVSTPISTGHNKRIQIVIFPMCDLEGKIVATIGFSKTSESSGVFKSEEINSTYYESLPLVVLAVDSTNKIIAYSKEFAKIIYGDLNENLIGNDINSVFQKDFITTLNTFINDKDKKEDFHFSYMFAEKGNIKTNVAIKKIYDASDNYLGTQIYFEIKNDLQLQIETKAQLYDTISQHGPDPFFIYDLENLKFLDVNDAALKLYSYKRNEFLNMDLTDLYAPEDIQTLIQSGDSKALNTGPWRHKKRDGSPILVELNRATIDYQDKKAHINIIKNVSDVVEERKKHQLLQYAYDNTSDLIMQTDKEGIIIDINDHVSKKIGYPKKEIESRPLVSLVSDDDRAKINKNIFHSGLLKTVNLDVSIKKPSGSLIKVMLIASPIKNYKGEIDNYIIILKPEEEKTEPKKVDKTQEDVYEQIDPPFLSNMFHEILTPINVILGFTQELWESMSSPSDEQKEAVDIIKENQKLLLQIMDNAVEYSTLQQKTIKFRSEEFKFIDIIDEIKENIKKVSESQKVELELGKISSSLILESDKQKLVSLLSLFIKFGLQITKENSIYLSAYNYDENNFIISLKDQKTSITQFLHKGLNDVFSDEETISRRNYGLSRFSIRLANKLIELLNASKALVSKGDSVIEFGLIFPLKFVVKEKAKIKVETIKPEIKEHKKAVREAEQISRDKVADGKKEFDHTALSCLYLEDQVDSQILFKSQMKDLRSIEFAPSLELAMPLLKTKRFDFIIMDINLQGEYNGLDALRIIKKMPGYGDIPIVASTAYMQPGARESFIAAGFDDFIPKPLLRDRVLDIIKNIF